MRTLATNETWAVAAAAAAWAAAFAEASRSADRGGMAEGPSNTSASFITQSYSSDGGDNGTVDASSTVPPDYFDVCSSLLMSVKVKYSGPYGYVACVLCTVGVLLNATNIVVLTRRQMLSPVNCLLTLVAAAEMSIVGLQLPAAVYFYVLRDPRLFAAWHVQDERPAALWYHVIATSGSVLCQTAAAWAMVAVAVCRYVSICHHRLGERLCTLRNARAACVAIVCSSAALLLPSWLTTVVTPATGLSYCSAIGSGDDSNHDELSDGSGKWWTLSYTALVEEGPALLAASSWLFAGAGKMAPAALLAAFTFLLVRAMHGIERRRATLVNTRRSSALTSTAGCERTSAAVAAAAVASAAAHMTGGDPASAAAAKSSRRAREQRRATRVLLAVVAVWLAIELPQGIMLAIVCSGYVDFIVAYELLGDLFNTSTLVAMSVNFFLYTSMMRRFRLTFFRTFLPCALFSHLHGSSNGSAGGHASKFVSGYETSVTLR